MLAPNLFAGLIPNYKIDKFIELTTGEQIKLLIEKDIFIIYKDNEDLYYWKIDEETDDYTIKFNCPEDFNNLDFESLNNQNLNILGEYLINGNHIKLNDFIYEDFENSIKTSVHLELTFSDRLKDTDYKLYTQPSNEAKLEYLHSKLDEIDPLNLAIMNPHFNEIDNTLELNTPYLTDNVDEEILHSIVWNWISGSRGGENVDFFNSSYLSLYRKEYKAFCIAQHYMAKINEINNGVNNESSPVINLKDDNLNGKTTIADRYSYFFTKINLIINLYKLKCYKKEIEHKEIKSLEKLDKFLSTIEDDNNLKKNNKEFWTNYMYAYFLSKTNILDDFRHAFDKTGSLYRMIGTIIQLDPKNFETRLKKVKEMNKKSISEISPYYRRIHEIIDPIITHYENLV